MADFRTERQTLLCKVHATVGTDPVPTVAANAIKAISPAVERNLGLIDTAEVTRSLDRQGRITGGGQASVSFGQILRGSGAAGTAPRWGAAMRGCAMSEATIGSAVTGTAQAGTSTTIQLAASDVSTDDEFNGAVVTLTGGTGSGQSRPISDSVASTDTLTVGFAWDTAPDNTSTYEVHAGNIYQPASSALELVAFYNYMHNSGAGDDVLKKVFDAAGNCRLTIPTGQLARADFQFTGRVSADADVTDPGAATFDTGASKPVLSASYYLGATAIKANELSLDFGCQVATPPDPSDAYGVDAAGIVARRVSGRLVPPRAIVATRDVLADWIAGTQTSLWIKWGTVAGSRMSLWIPTLRYTGQQGVDVNGFAFEGIPFDAEGDDAGFYLFAH